MSTNPRAARMMALLHPMAALAVALLIGGLIIAATSGEPPAAAVRDAMDAFGQLGQGAFGSANGILRTLARATPLLFSGLAVALALRAGLFNIGAEGQLLLGAMAAAWGGYAIHGLPAFAHLPLCLVLGASAGALSAFITGWLRAWRGTHEVIVAIMLNYVAIQLTHYLATGPLRSRGGYVSATPPILTTARLWSLPNSATDFSAGIALALVAAVCVAYLLRRTALGFEIRAVGANQDAARAAGIPVPQTIVKTMTLSGALAGIAGAVEVLAVHHRFFDQFSPGYGYDGIAVALLGDINAAGVVLASVLFGGLKSGALSMSAETQTPIQITGVIQAIVILAMGVRMLRHRMPAKHTRSGV